MTVKSAEAEEKQIGDCGMFNKPVKLYGGHISPCMGDASNQWVHCAFFESVEKIFADRFSGDFDKDVAFFPKCKADAFQSFSVSKPNWKDLKK